MIRDKIDNNDTGITSAVTIAKYSEMYINV